MSRAVVIRRAGIADAEAGVRCHLKCWRETYDGMIAADAMPDPGRDLADWTARWRDRLATGGVYWIAVDDTEDGVVGFAAAGPCRDDDAPRPLELYAVYVRQGRWGSGLSADLLDVAIGNDPACVWVLSDNRRAQAFYAKQGFVPDGATKHLDRLAADELRMVR